MNLAHLRKITEDAILTANIQVEGGLLKYHQDQSKKISVLTESSCYKFIFLSTEATMPLKKL